MRRTEVRGQKSEVGPQKRWDAVPLPLSLPHRPQYRGFMGVAEILEEIKSLPDAQRWQILERTRELLGPEPFLLVNADIWCDFDFSGLRGLDLGGRLSHLVLVPNPPQHPAGDFSL